MAKTDNNMRFYEAGRQVPQEAKKNFNAKGFKGTDINPMWRIKKLTEMFGPVGFGWYIEKKNSWRDEANGEILVQVEIELFVKDPNTGEWSKPIYGIGGNKIMEQFSSGPSVSDEGYKKAYTDAISVACKALGIGADVYYEKDTTKYSQYYVEPAPAAAPAPAPAPAKKRIEVNGENWQKAVEFLFKKDKNGKRGSLDKLLKNYAMSEETYQALVDLDQTAEQMVDIDKA